VYREIDAMLHVRRQVIGKHAPVSACIDWLVWCAACAEGGAHALSPTVFLVNWAQTRCMHGGSGPGEWLAWPGVAVNLDVAEEGIVVTSGKVYADCTAATSLSK